MNELIASQDWNGVAQRDNMSVKLANSQHNQQIREVSQQPTANGSLQQSYFCWLCWLLASQHIQQNREVSQQPTANKSLQQSYFPPEHGLMWPT